MGGLRDEVRRRRGQRDFEGLVVDSAHLNVVHRAFATVERFTTSDGIHQVGVAGSRRRVENTLERELEIVRGDRRAVGPVVVTNGEGVDEAVVGNRMALGGTGDDGAVSGFGVEAQELIAGDRRFPGTGNLVRIERARLTAVAHVEHALCMGGAGCDEHRRRDQHCFQKWVLHEGFSLAKARSSLVAVLRLLSRRRCCINASPNFLCDGP